MAQELKSHPIISIPIQGQHIGVGPGADLAPGSAFTECFTFSGSDAVSAVAYDKILNIYAIANGTGLGGTIDYFQVIDSIYRVAHTAVIGETINVISMDAGHVHVGTATDSLYFDSYLGSSVSLGAVASVDSFIGSTNDDSNPNWPANVSAAYVSSDGVFPQVFLFDVLSTKIDIFDITSGTPVIYRANTTALTISSVDYADGIIEVGTNGGRLSIDYALDLTTLSTTAGTSTAATVDGVPGVPTSGSAIINDTVNDIAEKVLTTTVVENLTLFSEDLTKDVWAETGVTTTVTQATENTDTSTHQVSQISVVGAVADEQYTFSAFVEQVAGTRNLSISYNNSGAYVGADPEIIVDMATGNVISNTDVTGFTSIVEGNGYRVSFTATTTGAGDIVTRLRLMDGVTASYAGDGVSTLIMTRMQLEKSANLHDYVCCTDTEANHVDDLTLSMPLISDLSFDVGTGPATFTRSTIATYKDAQGALQTAGIDEPRFETEGLLIESNSQNILLWTDDVSDITWDKVAGATTPAPDTITYTTNTNGRVEQAGSGLVGDYTLSGEFRGTPGDQIRLALVDQNAIIATNFITLTADYIRYEITGTMTGGTQRARILNDVSTAKTFNVKNMQMELQPFATSYIANTTVQNTRAADICSIPQSNIPLTNITVAATLSVNRADGTFQNAVGFQSTGGFNGLRLSSGNDRMRFAVEAVDVTSSAAFDFAVDEQRVLGTSGTGASGVQAVYVNGLSGVHVADQTRTAPLTDLFIGSNTTPSGQWRGHIKELKIYDVYIDLGSVNPADKPPAKRYVNTDIGGSVFTTFDTGLFVPTWGIVCAIDSSMGVDTGEIWDITGFATALPYCSFTTDDKFVTPGDFTLDTQVFVNFILTKDEAAIDTPVRVYNNSTAANGAPAILNTPGPVDYTAAAGGGNDLIAFCSVGFTLIRENITPGAFRDADYGHVTSVYNTGPMQRLSTSSQTGGAWLCDDNAVVGATFPDFSSIGNDALIVGTPSKVVFNPPCGDIQGALLPLATDEIQMKGDATDTLRGFQSTDGGATWLQRTGAQFLNATYNGTHWVVSGDASLDMAYARLTLSDLT